LIADWGNFIAGWFLIASFFIGALIFNCKVESMSLKLPDGTILPGIPSPATLNWLQFCFSAEGFFYAVAQFFMVGIMAQTPPEFGGGSRGCLQFAILFAGGIFFGLSGLVYPGCITNVTYVFRNEECPAPGIATGPYAWNAMAHFGITCFMVGTAIGFSGILPAPKNKLVSPFWGVTMFFLGAWTIGIFKFWLPVLAGGFDPNHNMAIDAKGNLVPTLDMTAPCLAWDWNWWFGMLGAIFLTIGATIFGLMNGSFGIKVA
jgi:hypothetical protein